MLNKVVDGSAYIPEGTSRTAGTNARLEGCVRDFDEGATRLVDFSDKECLGSVTVITVQVYSNIDIQNITVLEGAVVRDPV